MKIRRMAAWILIGGWLMLSAAACGESWFPTWQNTATPSPAPQADSTSFLFRGGVRWRMSPEEVKAAEETMQTEERSQSEWTVVYSVNRVEVSRFFADLVYIFQNRQLNMILYAFDPSEGESGFAYLAEALSAVHGEKTAADPLTVVALMDRVYPGMYTSGTLSDVWSWQKEDGTRIYLYRQKGASFSILYASPDSWLSGGGSYVTTGL